MSIGGGRTPLVAGNWKMNTTVPEGIALARAVASNARPAGVEIAVLPPFCHLWPIHDVLAGTGVGLGAQDVYWEAAGAFTGEISPSMLRGWCDWVLVGHSERRHLLGETDQQVARKLGAAVDHDLGVILAVGETLAEREQGQTLRVVHRQLDTALEGRQASAWRRSAVAYEPVWAIGTGRTASAEQAQAVCHAIRRRVVSLLGEDLAAGVRILYGGSVNPDNAGGIFAQPDIDGGLIGGASLKATEFAAIAAAATPDPNGGGQ